MPGRKRVALIGASVRGILGYAKPLLERYRDTHEIVAVFDINPRRMRVMNDVLGAAIPCYTDVDEMFRQARPQVVVISTMDSTHADYVEKAFEYAVESICEKPLCTSVDQCRRIRQVQQRHPDVRAWTAHNMRYLPYVLRIKELLDAGKIGRIRSIIFHEMLDQRHGASYFRRWNREKRNSGGLLVHKASHCFDALNWFVGSRARSLVARGSLSAYGPGASPFRGERCCDCPHGPQCPRYVNLDIDEFSHKLYFESRKPGDYTPDLCVFDPAIDIEDRATVGYVYENGVEVTFDLCAYCAYEGADVVIEGTQGRIEYHDDLSTRPMQEKAEYGLVQTVGRYMRVRRFEGPIEEVPVEEAGGSHGGADPRMLEDHFGASPHSLARASLEEGIQAVLIGAAANISIAEGRVVDVQSLLQDCHV